MKNLITVLLILIFLSSCSSDNESTSLNTTSLDFTEVITFQVDTLELDMISHIDENSFYITYSGDSGLNENVLKYNLTTLSQDNLVHPDFSESRQIEIINNLVYSISSNEIYTYDLNLNNPSPINNSFNGASNLRTTAYNDNLLLISGSDNIKSFEISTGTYINNLALSPTGYRDQRDGEIFNDNIYMFGGRSSFSNTWPEPDTVISLDEVMIYNITSDTWTQEQSLPYEMFESFTSKYNNTIIIAGNKNQDQTSSFIGSYDISSNTYSELNTSINLDNITIRGLTVVNDTIYLAYADLVSPMPNIITIKVVKASLL